MKPGRWIAGAIALGLVLAGVTGPLRSSSPPDDISQWGLVCFCLHSRTTPQRVIKQDDNGRLLYLAREGVSKAQLRRQGLQVSDDQLRLLQNWSLLSRIGNRYRTTFPVIGPEQMAVLRPRIRSLADEIAVHVAPEVADLRKILTEQGYADSHYAIVFSYVLDGLVWEELDHRHALPSSVPTAAHPEWNGALWAFSPARPGVEGTNEIASGPATLKSLWNDRVLEAQRAAAPAAGIRLLLAAIDQQPPGTDLRLPATGSIFTDSAGRLVVPVIQENGADPIRQVGLRFAGKVVQALNNPKAQQLAGSIRGATSQEGLLIITHELMWDVIARLTEIGAVERPEVLTRPGSDGVQSLLPLFFITFESDAVVPATGNGAFGNRVHLAANAR